MSVQTYPTRTGGGLNWVTGDGNGLGRPDGRTMPLPDGRPTVARPYKIATFGDSRANSSSGGSAIEVGFSGVSATYKNPARVGAWVECSLADSELAYNFGVSGDVASGWASSSRTSGKTITALKDYAPDVVLIQYGINDYISGTASATVAGYLTALIAWCLGFGAKVIFEATNIAASASYGASASTKLAATLAGNELVRTFCLGFPGRVCYVDNNSWLADGTGYLSSTYSGDGTHFNNNGAMLAGAAIARAARSILPPRDALAFSCGDPSAPNMIPWGGTGPTMYTVSAIGTVTLSTPTWNIDPVTGEPYAECTMTCGALAGGFAQGRLEIHAAGISGATPTIPVLVGDRLQGSARIVTDDGAGGLAQYQTLTMRQRLYSDTKYSDFGTVAGAAASSLLANVNGRILTPTITTATASVGISAVGSGQGFPLQIIVEFNAVSQVCRLRVYSPSLRCVNPRQMPYTLTLTASPMTYTNSTGRDQDVIITGGTVTSITFNRSGATPITTGLTTGMLRLAHGDGFTLTYSAGTPVLTLVPR